MKKGGFPKTENIRTSIMHAKEGNGRLHLLGLVSDGGVHSHQNHLYSLLSTAKEFGVPHVYIHMFGDGRDTDPKSSAMYLQELLDKINELGMEDTTKIGTVVGRYYAMDRDKRYSNIKLETLVFRLISLTPDGNVSKSPWRDLS